MSNTPQGEATAVNKADGALMVDQGWKGLLDKVIDENYTLLIRYDTILSIYMSYE